MFLMVLILRVGLNKKGFWLVKISRVRICLIGFELKLVRYLIVIGLFK